MKDENHFVTQSRRAAKKDKIKTQVQISFIMKISVRILKP